MGKTIIKKYANILTNAVIFPGVVIWEGTVIGANTVMHRDADPWTIYLGNPARKIKIRNDVKMIAYGFELTEKVKNV